MTNYILPEIDKSKENPSIKQVLEKIASQPEEKLSRPPAEMVREERGSCIQVTYASPNLL